MNKVQIQTIIAPIVAFVAAWLARKFPLLDQETWNTLVSSVAFAATGGFLAWITNKAGVADAAASYTDTKVVTDPATAKAVPNPDVVANTDVKVVPK